MKKLSPTQINTLTAAAARPDGNILPLPDTINAGIKPRVIQALLSRKLVDPIGDSHIINNTGRAAIGAKISTQETPSPSISAKEKPTQPRPGTKLDTLYQLLRRENGANIAEMAEAVGWLQHTVRGTLSGIFKKKYKLPVTEIESEEKHKRYKIIFAEDNSETSNTITDK